MQNKYTFSDLIEEYASSSTKEQMEDLSDLTDDFVEDVSKMQPELARNFLEDAKEILCPFMSEEEAKKFAGELENIDGTEGAHWKNPDEVFSAAERLGIPLETRRYKKWDLYAAVNMVYSDFYDKEKPDSMYIKDGYRFVADPDFKRIGKMKIYANSSHKK